MKEKRYVILSVLICTLAMCLVDAVIKPPYLYKSLSKIVVFLIIPYIYVARYDQEAFKKLFTPNKSNLKISIPLGILVFSVVMIAYFICRQFIDLGVIQNILTSNADINAENFVFVAIYISFFNSLLEEFFFRGYAFLIVKKYSSRKFAYIFSAFMFSFYHVGMTSGWFNILIYILALVGLFIGGCIFNYLNETCDNIYSSWIVHMCANFAINTIGLLMFGII